MIVGENGIIQKATIAKEKTIKEQEEEKEKLEDLKNKLQTTSNRDEITLKKVDTLYESTTYTGTITLNGIVTDYDCLIVFANASHNNSSTSTTIGGTSTIIDASNITIGDWNTKGITTYALGTNYNSSWYYWLQFFFSMDNQCTILERYSAGFNNPKIVKIIGIKK